MDIKHPLLSVSLDVGFLNGPAPPRRSPENQGLKTKNVVFVMVFFFECPCPDITLPHCIRSWAPSYESHEVVRVYSVVNTVGPIFAGPKLTLRVSGIWIGGRIWESKRRFVLRWGLRYTWYHMYILYVLLLYVTYKYVCMHY